MRGAIAVRDSERVPKVSLGLPVYNGERFLRVALDSLVQQDYEDFELIICDNASTDSTGSICLDYARRDTRIRYWRNEKNIGLAPNHNRVFELSRGDYFKWVAHDDEYPRQMLTRFVEVFADAPPSVSVIYSQCEIIDESGNVQETRSDHVEKRDPSPGRRLAHLLLNASIYNFTYGLIRSETLRKTRLHGSYPMTDRVLFAELAMLGELWEIPEPLLRLRFHEGRTFQANTTLRALRTLFDPVKSNSASFLGLESRVRWELIRSSYRTPSRLRDKFLCVSIAFGVPSWVRFKNFAGLQRRRLRLPLRRSSWACKG
jgi:glycosyltransferase involved in cell wall biosynthesis